LVCVYALAACAVTSPSCLSESAVNPRTAGAGAVSQRGEEGAPPVGAVPTFSPTADIEMIPPKEARKPLKGNPKLGSSLNQLVEAYRRGGIVEAQSYAMSHNMVLQDDRVQVTIVTTEGTIGDVRCAVETVGGEYQAHHRNLLQALVPIGGLEVLAQRPDIQVIREPRRAIVL
jgi:hypothetical protein